MAGGTKVKHNQKEVYFENYCNKCKHRKKGEHEDPCDICLATAVRYDGSRKPIKFEKR